MINVDSFGENKDLAFPQRVYYEEEITNPDIL